MDLRFIYGPHSLQLETIWKGIMVAKLNPTFPRVLDWHRSQQVLNFYDVISERRDQLQNLPLCSIGSTVHIYRTSQSSDPRDKVFGLLGISGQHFHIFGANSSSSFSFLATNFRFPDTSHSRLTLHTYRMLWCPSLNKISSRLQHDHAESLYDCSNFYITCTPGYICPSRSWSPILQQDRWSTILGPRFVYRGETILLRVDQNEIFCCNPIALKFSIGWRQTHSSRIFTRSNQPLERVDWEHRQWTRSFKPAASLQRTRVVICTLKWVTSGRYEEIVYCRQAYRWLLWTSRAHGRLLQRNTAFETLFSRIMYFGLHRTGQVNILKTLLEDPGTFIRMSIKDPETPLKFNNMMCMLRRRLSRSTMKRSSPAIASAEDCAMGSECENTDLLDWVHCTSDPFATSWSACFKHRRYFRTSRGYLGLGILTLRPEGIAYTSLKELQCRIFSGQFLKTLQMASN